MPQEARLDSAGTLHHVMGLGSGLSLDLFGPKPLLYSFVSRPINAFAMLTLSH